MARLIRIALATALVAVVAGGCGTEEEGRALVAETEGLYLDVNGLKYQIEMSRYMNPNDVEDQEYLVGLPESSAPPTEDEIYFGVWVRVENVSEDRDAAGRERVGDPRHAGERVPAARDRHGASTRSRSRPSTCRPRPCSRWPAQPPARGRPRACCCCSRSPTSPSRTARWSCAFSNGGGSEEGTYDLDV